MNDVLRAPGRQLDPEARAFMESGFGHDFSRVRIHADAKAAESARTLGALAFTVGTDIVFGEGRHAPHTKDGRFLLAHELAHTLQQATSIARKPDPSPAPQLEIGGPALERARAYEPGFRPHVPGAPAIPSPPVPLETTAPPGPCPPAADVRRELRENNIASQTETEMQRDINLGRSRAAAGTTSVTPRMIRQADRAIRSEFGDVLPTGRDFKARESVSVRTPADFAQLRVPDAASARRRIAMAALDISGELLRSLCIADPSNAQLQSEVAAPILNRRGIHFVRDHEAGRTGGQTTFSETGGVVTRHVDIPGENRNMGHIVVHEAMHFYVSDGYRRTAESSPLRRQMMEGGAEFLARQVIHQRLDGLPEFQINYSTYFSEFSYVSNYLMRGGLSSFKLAYFQGRVDLLGLRPVQPKLAVSRPGDELERDADRMAEAVVRREAPVTSEQSDPHSACFWTENSPVLVAGRPLGLQIQREPHGAPHDRMVVERARRRLRVLRQFVDEWSGRQARRLATSRELGPLLERRRRMDVQAAESGADAAERLFPGVRAQTERRNLAALNRRPLTIDVSEDEVLFRARFHVRFEDATMERRFGELAASLQRGIQNVWSQRLRGQVFGQRQFRIVPQVTRIASDAARDRNFWLITVRPRNDSPIAYPGCAFEQNQGGAPTSATDPNCDGGVMTIPPAHITNAGVLGHELLHLFGLVDRYDQAVDIRPGQRAVVRLDPTRETGGRPDPLGAQQGTILAEDLAFVFDRLGIYRMEESRGLEVLRRLERQGMGIGAVVAEIQRLEQIIRLGYDPGSLIRPRRDFTEQMIRSAEDL